MLTHVESPKINFDRVELHDAHTAERKIFSPIQFQIAIDDALKLIQPEKTAAVLAVYDWQSGKVRGVAALKINKQWSMIGILEHSLKDKGESGGFIAIRGDW